MLRNSLLMVAVVGFASCSEPQSEQPNEGGVETIETATRDYQSEGKEIAMKSFMALSGELSKAMQDGGVEAAVNYCNINALAITDSLSDYHGVTLRRATDRPRNPKNLADEQEQMILGIWADKLDMNDELKPTVFEDEEFAHFYAPIRIQPQCMSCHGVVGETMPKENAKFISGLYPKDQAKGYQVGDLRGLWHITFDKTKK